MRGIILKIRIALLILLLGGMSGLAAPAQAHAELVRSEPPADAHLQQSPAQINLYFSEDIEPAMSEISVYDNTGSRVNNRTAQVDPADSTDLTVSLPKLKDGIYTVAWKTASKDDSHMTAGSFVIYVGNIDANITNRVIKSSQAPEIFPGQVVVKWLLYLALAVLAGGVIFSLFVEKPAIWRIGNGESGAEQYGRVFQGLMAASLVLGLGASLLGVLVQAAIFQGKTIVSPWDPQATTVLFHTRYGVLTLVRIASLLVLSGLLLPVRSGWNRWVAFPFILVLLLTLSLDSHAAAQVNTVLPLAADLLHLAAASVWIGGLGLFLATLFILKRQEPVMRNRMVSFLLPRFTSLALTSLGVLALTGIYQAVLDVGSLSDLVVTAYGQALIVKLLIALLMVGLGGYHHFIVNPRIQQAAQQSEESSTWVGHFRRTLTVEALLGAVLLLWVGVFTSLPPALSPQLVQSAQQGNIQLKLAISPVRTGMNTFTLDVTSNGGPDQDISGAEILFFSSNDSIPPIEAVLEDLGNGKFQIRGGYMSYPDRWKLRVIVIRNKQLNVVEDFSVNLRSFLFQS